MLCEPAHCRWWQAGGAAAQSCYLIDAACEVLSAPSLAEIFWEMVSWGGLEIANNNCQSSSLFICFHPDIQKPNMGLGMILDSAVGMFPYKIGPLLQLLTALVSNKSTVIKVGLTLILMLSWALGR